MHYCIRLSWIGVVFAMAITSAIAAQTTGTILTYGIFKFVKQGELRNDAETNTGKIIHRPTIELVEQTSRIPLQKGTVFAYQYRLSLPGITQETRLKRVLLHPPMRRPDGPVITGSTRMLKKQVRQGGILAIDGYTFSEDYELVPGNWTFEIWHQGKRLITQTFVCYLAQPGPALTRTGNSD